MRRQRRVFALSGIAVAVVVTAAACGGGSSGGGNTAKVAPNTGGSTAGAVVTTHSGPDGTYLTDGKGRTLYLWAADSSSSSACNGTCATSWPAYTTSGTPSASGKAKQSMLATSKRNDGSTQVTYNGHPLYYYSGDSAAGDMNGQGSNQYGAVWYIVAPNGSSISAAKKAPTPASSSSSSGETGWG